MDQWTENDFKFVNREKDMEMDTGCTDACM